MSISSAQQEDADPAALTFRLADMPTDKRILLSLRDTVYVQDQGRLADPHDMATTFDRFDGQAAYILAEYDGKPVGTVKVIPDSPAGLPCEDMIDISAVRGSDRGGARLIEISHLMAIPSVRNRTVGMALMRQALIYAVWRYDATHVLGDFFADERGGLLSFYQTIGFQVVGEPYMDARFQGAPLSVVGALSVADAVARLPGSTGRERQLLEYFFADYPDYPGDRHRYEVRPDPRTNQRTHRQLLAEAKAAHNHPTYAKMSFAMGCGVQRAGAGSSVLDEGGRPYLAMFDQYGNQSFGYSHERIIAAIREQLDSGVLNSTKVMFEEEQIRLTERLSALTNGRLPYAYLANSGGETIDNALKLARAATGRPKFVTAVGCFHGKTFGALSASGRPEHRALFEPLLRHFQQVPFGDLAALADAVDERTAAVLLEPVQAEAGVIVPPPDYLRQVRRLCTERGALLVLDEMQTAFGRCGTFFAFEQWGVTPDLVCMGKAFGGGMLAISAVLGTEAVWESLKALPSTFGSSLGGNPLACRVGLESIAIATEPEFLDGVRTRAAIIDHRLTELAARYPELIREHRGIGMMHGLDFHDESLGGLVLGLLMERRITSTYSLYNNSVLRVQPPMVIAEDDLARLLDELERVLATVEAYRADTRQEGIGVLPPIVYTARLKHGAAGLLAALAAQPHLLDPFALDPRAARQPADGPGAVEFAGTLGSGLVVWSDTTEWSARGVTHRTRPDWLWTKLERDVAVRAARGNDGACEVTVTIDWDAGTGDYEGLLGGWISYFVRTRLAALLDDLEANLKGMS